MMKKIVEIMGEKLGMSRASETVFGEPLEFKSVTIIPVARLTHYDSIPGEENEYGEKGAFKKSPMGYLEMRGDTVRFISLYDYTEFFALGALSGAGACILLSFLFRRSSDTKKREEKPREHSGRKILKTLAIALGAGVLGYYLSRFIPSLSSSYEAMADIEKEILAYGDREKKTGQICLDPIDEDLEATWSRAEVVTIDEPIDSLLEDD